MDVVLRQRVVVLVQVRATAVQERRMQRGEALGAAEHACGGIAREWRERLYRVAHRRLDCTTERAAEIVEDRALRLVPNVARGRLVSAVRDVLGERFGGGHSKIRFNWRNERSRRAVDSC